MLWKANSEEGWNKLLLKVTFTVWCCWRVSCFIFDYNYCPFFVIKFHLDSFHLFFISGIWEFGNILLSSYANFSNVLISVLFVYLLPRLLFSEFAEKWKASYHAFGILDRTRYSGSSFQHQILHTDVQSRNSGFEHTLSKSSWFLLIKSCLSSTQWESCLMGKNILTLKEVWYVMK